MTSSKLLHNDLAALDIKAFADRGCWLVIRHPMSGEPLVDEKGNQWRMLLAGKDSFVYRRSTSEAVQRRFKDTDPTPESYEIEQIRVLSACVLDFENFVQGGDSLPFTPDNAFMLVERFPWLREQIEAFILKRENYFLDSTPV